MVSRPGRARMVGVIRDAQVQRSRLVKETEHAYIFYCTKGKDEGRPFHWVIPKTTLMSESCAASAKMVAQLRLEPDEDDPAPWLVMQFGPSTTKLT